MFKAYAIFCALMMAFAMWWCLGGAHAVFVTGFTFEQSVRDIYFMGVALSPHEYISGFWKTRNRGVAF